MFECTSCILRCMRAVGGDALPLRPVLPRHLRLRLTTPHPPRRPSARAASTAAAGTASTTVATLSTPANALAADNNDNIEKALKIELRYLKDPLKLSEHVRYTLRCDKPAKALDLCRLASKQMSCVVSWNAVVDWHMRRFRVNDAIKIYNDMKKRAQFPDSYTYMLLLRGLGMRTHVGQPVREENVVKAVSIYNSMNGPSAHVKPAIMHTNAALNVCAMALDMDALWGIAGQIPDKGPAAADHVTYTIILNAIRFAAYGNNPRGLPLEQLAARRQKAVNEGRRVWLDVVRKWRAGEVRIDEDLVGAMGRLLLTSKSIQDWDNVLDLVQQTMKIERLLPPVGDHARRTEHVPHQEDPAQPAEEEIDAEGFTDSPAATAFKPVTPIHPEPARSKNPPSLAWVQPSNQTLSLLIDACQNMRTPKTASAYWHLLTSPPYSLQPDIQNFDALLRLHALNRASAKAAALLSTDFPAAGLTPKNSTYRIAMHACQRDLKNPRVLDHASAIVATMLAQAADPDPQTLTEYLSLALTTNDGPQIAAVIDRLDPLVHSLRSRMLYGADAAPKSPHADLRDLKGANLFLQTLVGAVDSLIHRRLVPEDEVKAWQARRADLTHFLGRAKANQDRRAAALEDKRDPSRPKGEEEGKVGSREALRMSRAQWAVRQFKWNDPERKSRRKESGRWEREARMNPPLHEGLKRGFGMGGE